MLVLTRKTAQKIHIGNDITVTILRLTGRAVKVGIEAPVETRVLRSGLAALAGPEAENEPLESRNSKSPLCCRPR
jgi:carbon storage regulator CsrA